MAVEGGCVSMQTAGKTVDPVSMIQRSNEEHEEEPEEEVEEDSEFIDEVHLTSLSVFLSCFSSVTVLLFIF